MPRLKKKPLSRSFDLDSVFSSLKAHRAFEAKIANYWCEASSRITPLSQDQVEYITLEVLACMASEQNTTELKANEKAREAIEYLLKWCNFEPHDNGLPKVTFVRNPRLVALEAALVRVKPIAQPPQRSWIPQAQHLRSKLRALYAGTNVPVGVSATSHTVKFIGLALREVGHTAATDGAISLEFRKR